MTEPLALPEDNGVSPCFVNCGKRACRELGCIRVYNARQESDEPAVAAVTEEHT